MAMYDLICGGRKHGSSNSQYSEAYNAGKSSFQKHYTHDKGFTDKHDDKGVHYEKD